jgi:glutamine synthetase
MYTKQIQIESRVLGEMALSQILPPAVEYQNELLLNYGQLKDCGFETEAEENKSYIAMLSRHINETRRLVFEMIEARKKANEIEESREKALSYCHEIKPFFEKIRYHADKLELYVDDKLWALPKYWELLFVR